MASTVENQVGWSTEFLVAIRALNGLAGVDGHVGFKGGVLREGFVAEFAFVRFRTGVDTNVTFESVGLGELEATVVAVVGTFAGVRSTMAAQADLGEKRFV